jgi:hypothetical protein
MHEMHETKNDVRSSRNPSVHFVHSVVASKS